MLAEVLQTQSSPAFHSFRQLPVNAPVAREITIAQINTLRPQVVLCCGMAESRRNLSLEARAVVGNQTLYTNVDLEDLAAGLTATEISLDAGRFVCNSLYYAMLKYLRQHHPTTQCLFIHVPTSTSANWKSMVADFRIILKRVTTT